MPIAIDGGRIPNRLKRENRARSIRSASRQETQSERIRIALINNMPDAALEDTEVQFIDLLESAAGDLPVSLKLFSLPKVPRGDAGLQHLNDFYFDINDLLSSRFDGMIMTGTEPRQPDLRDEPYWPALGEVLDWAERNTTSTVLSCLAAHAGVLYSDGIPRCRLADKQFGVFEYEKVSDHGLTVGCGESLQIPHSRWNEVRADALASCDYKILTQSPHAGVDLFVKKKKGSLFVHFQGHPEYGSRTLHKEYRRDIKRFLKKERDTYPNMPHGYFDAAARKLLCDFQANAVANSSEDAMAGFPEAAVVDTIQGAWHVSGAAIYRNWLQHLIASKARVSAPTTMKRVVGG